MTSKFASGVHVKIDQVTYEHPRLLTRGGSVGCVLKNFNLHCAASKITAIIGPSGCGKSTILDLVAGLRKPAEGTISLTKDDKPIEPRIGFIFQRENCLPWLTIEKNLRFGHTSTIAEFDSIVRGLQLKDLLSRFPHELSGGQQQRVAIGRLLLRRPDLVLCDEPWSSLDIASRRLMVDRVGNLIHQIGATGILVTHEPAEAWRIADTLIVLSGRPVTIKESINVTASLRSDPVALEQFTRRYLSILDGADEEITARSGLPPLDIQDVN